MDINQRWVEFETIATTQINDPSFKLAIQERNLKVIKLFCCLYEKTDLIKEIPENGNLGLKGPRMEIF